MEAPGPGPGAPPEPHRPTAGRDRQGRALHAPARPAPGYPRAHRGAAALLASCAAAAVASQPVRGLASLHPLRHPPGLPAP
eukprot:8580934-Lingulodinium_polyedra.AAC.1